MSDYISEDNLVLILRYLPVKTLLRFRSVSKGWKQLIDSPAFVQEHLSVLKPRFFVEYGGRRYLAVDPRPRPLVESLKIPNTNGRFSIVGTLHGVVCLYDISNFVLWNPSIRMLSYIPLPLDFKWFVDHRKHTCYGFWIDPASKEFKIIIVKRSPDVNCYLYSSIRRDWSVIPTGKIGNWKPCKGGPPVMIGGLAHWGGCLDELMNQFMDECNWEHDHKDKVVLSFDFVQQSFELIEMPDLRDYKTAPFRWQDTLSLLCWDTHFPRRCKIYLRREDYWVKMFSFKVYESLVHVFWAMEDIEERKKKGKRKREMEESICDSPGETQENLRVLASIISDSSSLTGDLVLDGPKTGCKPLKKGLEWFDKINIVYDFVDSLLFPS